MAKGFRWLICIAMVLAFATAMAGTACADGTRTITMIQELLNDTDFLVTYEDSGKTCYGVFHPDETITPLFLSEDATWQMLLPDVPRKPDYSFGVLPNGDYYEQVYTGKLDQGGIRIRQKDSGDTLYMSSTGNGAEMVLGAWEDAVILLRRVSGFTDNTWTICAIDHYGNRISKEHDAGKYGPDLYYGMENLGCGIFVSGIGWGPTCVFNLNADKFYCTETWCFASSFWCRVCYWPESIIRRLQKRRVKSFRRIFKFASLLHNPDITERSS